MTKGELAPAKTSGLAKLVGLIALAVAGQFLSRWLGGRHVTNLGAPAQKVSFGADLILLACVPFGFYLAPKLSLPGTPLYDRLIRREGIARELNYAFYRSLVLVVVTFVAALAVAMLSHSAVHPEGNHTPTPLPVAMLLALAAALREEIEFRLGLLTVLAWLINRTQHAIHTERKSVALWIANILQAMAFGAVHLVVSANTASTLSLLNVVREPRTVSGVVFGYAYLNYGLDTSIMTHALFDASISALATVFARL
jgi:hypothetical protein